MTTKAKSKPEITPYYRARLSCHVGLWALKNQASPAGVTPMEYAVYNLLHAVEDIAEGLEEKQK